MQKRLFVNILTGYVGKATGMVLGILVVPFLIHKLGKESFGLIIMAESMICLIEMISTSIRTAIAHHTTFSLSQGKKHDFKEYLSTGRGMLFVTAGVVLLAGAIASFNAPVFFHITGKLSDQARMLFLTMTISFAITIPNIVYWSVLYSHQRLDLINITASTSIILRTLCLFIAFSILPAKWISLTTYGIVYLVMTWTKNYLIYWWHQKIMLDEKITLRNFNPRKVREMLSYSMFSSIGQLGYVLYENAMGMVLFFFWGPAANAVYAVSVKFPSALERLFEEPAWALTPTFTEYYAKHALENLRILFFTYTKFVCLMVIPICLGIMFFSEEIIRLWVGDDFTQAAVILPLHVSYVMVSVPFSACYCIMSASAKVKIPGLATGPTLFVMLVVGVLFAKVFHLGLYGIVLAEALISVLFAALFLPSYCCHIAKIDLKHYWVEAYLKPFGWAAATTLLFLGIFYFTNTKFLSMRALALGVLFTSLYVLGGFSIVLHPNEKNYIFGLANRLLRRLGINGMRI